MDGRTDKASYRDARTHLKSPSESHQISLIEELLGDVPGPLLVDVVGFGGVAEVRAVEHVLEDADSVRVVVRMHHMIVEAARRGCRRDFSCFHHRLEIGC